MCMHTLLLLCLLLVLSVECSSHKFCYYHYTIHYSVTVCLEMLFFSIAHWCVFPADEWEPGYRPKEFAKPGLGLQDFARDVKYIISSRRRRHVEDGGDASDHATGSESDVVEEAEVVVLDALALDEHDDEEMVREVNHRRGTPYQVAPQESGSLT